MLPFTVDFRPGDPVYEQVMFAVKKAVATGHLAVGGRFPSVRLLSQGLRINPNTAHKVVAALTAEGVLTVHPGIGTVVAPPAAGSAEDRTALLDDELRAPRRRGARRLGSTKTRSSPRCAALAQVSPKIMNAIECQASSARLVAPGGRRADLHGATGCFYALLGPGAGKTTALSCSSPPAPDAGRSRVLGCDSTGSPRRTFNASAVAEAGSARMDDRGATARLLPPALPTWDEARAPVHDVRPARGSPIKSCRAAEDEGGAAEQPRLPPRAHGARRAVQRPRSLVRDEFIQGLLELPTDDRPRTFVVSSHDIDEVEKLADLVASWPRAGCSCESADGLRARFRRVEILGDDRRARRHTTDRVDEIRQPAPIVLQFVHTAFAAADTAPNSPPIPPPAASFRAMSLRKSSSSSPASNAPPPTRRRMTSRSKFSPRIFRRYWPLAVLAAAFVVFETLGPLWGLNPRLATGTSIRSSTVSGSGP